MSPFASGGFHSHTSAPHVEPRLSYAPSYAPSSLDGSTSSPVWSLGALGPYDSGRPRLSLLTEIGRKYPGFPTPLSPTHSAKQVYPSPSDRAMSPAVRSVSPMSMDGSEMCGPSRRCNSHGYQHYASAMGLIDSIVAQPSPRHSPATYTPPPTPARSSSNAFSPRSPILESLYIRRPPHMEISNGDLTSPLSSRSTTILSYTSHRPITSGLLALPPLNENQVAEYRFWTPCGRRACAFGCGSRNEGEFAAQKRLFRSAADVDNEERLRGGEVDGSSGDGSPVEVEVKKSEWAGQRYVGDWQGFLRRCEREGVAKF
jgi:hypothetical protein